MPSDWGACCEPPTYTNWCIAILPYFENALYARYDQESRNNLPINQIPHTVPDWKDNAYVREQIVSVYQCPDDPWKDTLEKPASGGPGGNASPSNFRHSSYKGVAGATDHYSFFDNSSWCGGAGGDGTVLPERWKGLLHITTKPGSKICKPPYADGFVFPESLDSVKDGLTNTFAVGEYATKSVSTRGTFWAYSYAQYVLGHTIPETRTMIPDYGATGTPGTCAGTPGESGEQACKRVFASMHPNGLNFASVDDSVHFVSMYIDVYVYFALGTIANAQGDNDPYNVPYIPYEKTAQAP